MEKEGPEGHGRSLPPSPDFASLSEAAVETADLRTRIFALIGSLVFAWSNNESMFIYVLMLLLRTDEASAAIVFGTLNTTRARLDLVQRLAKAHVRDAEVATRLSDIIRRFEAGTRARNEFNHSMFRVDGTGVITHTLAMRIEEKKGALIFGKERALDEARLQRIEETVARMNELNRDLWRFLPVLESEMKGNKAP